MAESNDQGHGKPTMQPWDEHNQELVSNVHPHDWQNPEPAERYHMVVIGAGTGGLVTAAIAANLGAKVALIERHLMGGDCLNVGCVPSKGVISAARAWHQVEANRETFGAPASSGEAGDFAHAMERMRRLRAKISPIDGAPRFSGLGIDVFLGEGRFVASDAVEVGGARLKFRRAVIATGARAAAPPIPGLDQVDYLTNESVFSLTELPRRFGVIGAGPIGSEMSQSFARFGSEVHLFDMAPHVLSREDADAAQVVQKAMVEDGVKLHMSVKIVAVEKDGDEKIVVAETQGGETEKYPVDQLLVAVGRAPNTDSLGLEAAGVAYGRQGVKVNDRLQTSNSRVYAVGDVTDIPYKFTHLADFHARTVIGNALFFGRGKASQLVVPWATYTSPEIAHVGLYEEQAQEQGYEVETLTIELEDNDRALLDGENEGFLRLHLKKGSDEILGGTLVAAHAGDMIGPLALAVTHGIGLSKFGSTIFPYPTQGEIFRKAGDTYNKRKLSPAVAKFMEIWFKIFN